MGLKAPHLLIIITRIGGFDNEKRKFMLGSRNIIYFWCRSQMAARFEDPDHRRLSACFNRYSTSTVFRREKELQKMNLRTIRLEQGLSVPALSRLSGVPVRTIEDIEKRGDCKVSTAKLLASALNVSLDSLCADEEPNK